MSAHPSQTEPDDSTPRDVYETVLRVVDFQTSPDQLPGVRPETVTTILCQHGEHDYDTIRGALTQAETNGDLVVWRDARGDVRVTRCTESDLQRLLGHFNCELEAPADACRRIVERIRAVIDDA